MTLHQLETELRETIERWALKYDVEAAQSPHGRPATEMLVQELVAQVWADVG